MRFKTKLFFASHPDKVEKVEEITELKDIFSLDLLRFLHSKKIMEQSPSKIKETLMYKFHINQKANLTCLQCRKKICQSCKEAFEKKVLKLNLSSAEKRLL